MNEATLLAKAREHGCTLKEARLAYNHLKHGNGARAAREAGYSSHTARQIASESLTKPNVLDLQTELAAELEAIKDLDGNTVLAGLLKMANSADQDGTKVRAWELLGKAKRLFVERIETDSPAQGLEDQIKASLPPEQALAVLQALGLVAPETETPDDAGN